MLAALTLVALAQDAPDLQAWQDDRRRTERAASAVLLGWAGANLVGGTVGAVVAEDPRARSALAGSAGWNVVNAGLAVPGLVARPPVPATRTEALERASRLDGALLLNAGLDVAYVVGGLALQDRGQRTSDPRLTGLGDALVVQGAFLLGFDLIFHHAARRHTRRLF